MRLDFCAWLPAPWCMWLNILAALGMATAFVAFCFLLYESWKEGDDDH